MSLAAGITRVERAVAAFERGLIVVLLAVMAGSVFLDALHRIFAAEEGRSARLLMAFLPASWHERARTVLAPLLLGAVTFVVVLLALAARDRAGGSATSRRSRWLRAGALTAGQVAATRLLIWALPNGLVFSQQMSLCFMLWIALAGASLGARERAHIAFELAGQIWPAPLRRPAERLARVLAAGFSFFLALLAAAHTHEHYLEWSSSDGAAGRFEAFTVPRFLIYGFLPFPFVVMGLRFLLFGVRADPEPPAPVVDAPKAAS